MKEKYYKINKEFAARAGLTADLREEIGDDLLLSEKDVKMISLTVEERVKALDGVEFVEPENTKENG